jgi:hypothetical protein
VGVEPQIASITDVLPLVARHFGVQVPASARTADRAA